MKDDAVNIIEIEYEVSTTDDYEKVWVITWTLNL
tara:strand:+ start:2179 stop:2280 length:102 start_codon:yes stop_codon:yes gene_type:complete